MTEVDDAGNNMAPAIPRDGSVPINIRGGYLKAFPDRALYRDLSIDG